MVLLRALFPQTHTIRYTGLFLRPLRPLTALSTHPPFTALPAFHPHISPHIPTTHHPPLSAPVVELISMVLLGFLAAAILRFDAQRACARQQGRLPRGADASAVMASASDFPKPYFYTCIFGYCVGVVLRALAQVGIDGCQPLILYITPGCLICVVALAVVKGEIAALLAFGSGGGSVKRKM